MIRRYVLHIAVEIDDEGEWDCGCDETHALMRLAHFLKAYWYTRGGGPKVSKAFLLREYAEISEIDFQKLFENSMDQKGV
jgi:hypothetical protein